jgi:2-(1,2-epoxy-1,2-dihydrophenyl)acetyl-CoA isomerase
MSKEGHMAYDTLLYAIDPGIGTITLNRPAVLNAINPRMIEELQDVLAKIKDDASVRAIVLTGAGRGFCSGADLKARERVAPSEIPPGASQVGADRLRRTYNPLIMAIRSIEKPFIASVNGVAAGAGCNIALACDLVIASEEARFGNVFVRIGLIPDCGGHFFLPRLIGFHKAAELMFTGDLIEAREAERIGLINRVVPHADLQPSTRELAERLAHGPTSAIGLCKRTLNIGMTADLATVLEAEAEGQGVASQTDDHGEGVQAFLEKRPARFMGK